MNEAAQITPAQLRGAAEAEAAGFPALLARARHLAATLNLGAHGRRRAGVGEEFWQYRPAIAGDAMREIDWRRSARSDAQFIRQKEWQSAQAVNLWIDPGAAMQFAGAAGAETKLTRAQTLGMAIAILLSKAGERVGLMDDPEPPKQGEIQINKMALSLCNAAQTPDYATPPQKLLAKGSRAIFLSDFLGDWPAMVRALSAAADQDVQGCLVQVLDVQEASFPFTGRTIFESMQGSVRFETLRANALREAYLERLAEREAQLRDLARQTGWRFYRHLTNEPAQSALLWMYSALEADI